MCVCVRVCVCVSILLLINVVLFILFKDPDPPIIDYVEMEEETPETLKVSSTVCWLYAITRQSEGVVRTTVKDNGKWQNLTLSAVAPKPLNRSSQNLKHVIMSRTTITKKFGLNPHMGFCSQYTRNTTPENLECLLHFFSPSEHLHVYRRDHWTYLHV